jgi:orotidine-5'-phosphate decarboxylase
MVHHFADRLTAAVRRKKTPALVGIDPRLANLPAPLQPNDDSPSPEQIATAFVQFSHGIIDVVAPLIPAVKPQSAFFEQIGPAGTAALGEVIQYARSKGLVVITDAKRNDIGSTAEAYAQAYIGPSGSNPFASDCLTVSPYLGEDSLDPFVQVAQRNGNGIFVLVKTSNSGGGRFQDLVANGEPIYQHVAQLVNQLALNTPGQDTSHAYGCVGAVVGATYPEQLVALRQSMPNTWLLVPGYGAQGGGASDVAGGFDEHGLGAIINSSRGIIFAYEREKFRDKFSPQDWQRAVEAATLDMIAELAAETPAGKLQDAS